MPIIEKTYLFKNTQCSYVFESKHQKSLPSCLSKEFALFLANNAMLSRAHQNNCGEKAEFIGKNIKTNSRIKNIKFLIMNDWLSSKQPYTPYRSKGFTTGASYHALCYFEYDNLFFSCDLNTNTNDYPYLQIFVSENNNKLCNLLNSIYACKEIYLLNIGENWFDIYKPGKLKEKEFDSILSTEEFETNTLKEDPHFNGHDNDTKASRCFRV